MTARGYLRGHPIEWDEDGERFLYSDTLEPTEGNPRPCGHCGEPDTPEGHDACMGTLPGVRNACCGHGQIGEGYVEFANGVMIRGSFSVEHHKDTP